MATPASVLGSRLVVEWTDQYSGGTWTDDVTSDVLGQDTAGNRPTTTTTPGGSTVLLFDGTNDLVRCDFGANSTIQALADLPAIGSGQRLFYAVFRIPVALTGDGKAFYNTGDSGVQVRGYSNGRLELYKNTPSYSTFQSDDPVDDNTWHTLILLSNEGGPTTSMYVDGVLQAATGAWAIGAPGDWGAYGINFGGFAGELGQVGFARTATTFGADIAALHSALDEVINGASGVTGSLSVTLGALTSSSAGTSPIVGAVSRTLGALTSTAAGGSPIVGTFAGTLGTLTSSSEGSSPIVGSSSVTLSDVGLSSTATIGEAIGGSLSVTLEALASSSAATSPVRGTLAGTLDGISLTCAGTSPLFGGLGATLGSVSCSSSGNSTITGTSGATLASLGIACTATSPVIATASATLSDVSLISTATETEPPATGALVATLGGVVLSGVIVVLDIGPSDLVTVSTSITAAPTIPEFDWAAADAAVTVTIT